MANLRKEYTDIMNRKHTVEHFMADNEKEKSKEQIVQQLAHIFRKPGKRMTA